MLVFGRGHPWSVCPGRKDSQRLGQRQIDDHPLKDNAADTYHYNADAYDGNEYDAYAYDDHPLKDHAEC